MAAPVVDTGPEVELVGFEVVGLDVVGFEVAGVEPDVDEVPTEVEGPVVEEPTLVDDEPDEVGVCPVVDVGREVTVDDGPVVDVVGTVVVGRVVVVGGPLVTATGREASDGGPDWSPNWAITRTSNSTSIGTATSTVVTEPSTSTGSGSRGSDEPSRRASTTR